MTDENTASKMEQETSRIIRISTSRYFLIPGVTLKNHEWLESFVDNVYEIYVDDEEKKVTFVLKKYAKR